VSRVYTSTQAGVQPPTGLPPGSLDPAGGLTASVHEYPPMQYTAVQTPPLQYEGQYTAPVVPASPLAPIEATPEAVQHVAVQAVQPLADVATPLLELTSSTTATSPFVPAPPAAVAAAAADPALQISQALVPDLTVGRLPSLLNSERQLLSSGVPTQASLLAGNSSSSAGPLDMESGSEAAEAAAAAAAGVGEASKTEAAAAAAAAAVEQPAAASASVIGSAAQPVVPVEVVGGSLGAGPMVEASAVPASPLEPQYHNYLTEGLQSTLKWVQELLLVNPADSALGRQAATSAAVDQLSGPALREVRSEQLRVAATSLSSLVDQLAEAGSRYKVSDPQEAEALGAVLAQLSAMSDKLAAAAARRAEVEVPPAATTLAELDSVVSGYRDPVLHVLEEVYRTIVEDSGVREMMLGIKQLGDQLSASMEEAWGSAPPITKLVAYLGALVGALFVMRVRIGAGSGVLPPPRSDGGVDMRDLDTAGMEGDALSPAGAAADQGAVGTTAPGGPAGGLSASGPFGGPLVQPPGGLSEPTVLVRAPADGLTPAAAAGGVWWAQPLPDSAGGGGGTNSGSGSAPVAAGVGAARSGPAGGTGMQVGGPAAGYNGNGSGRNAVQEAWAAFRQASSSPAAPAAPPQPGAGSAPTPSSAAAAVAAGAFQAVSSTVAVASSGMSAVASAAMSAAAATAAVSQEDVKLAELERAAEGRRLEMERVKQREVLKDRLSWATLALGPVVAVIPGGEPVREEIDALIAQLEAITPTDKPLNVKVDVNRLATVNPLEPPPADPDALLLGDWALIYASNGPDSDAHNHGEATKTSNVVAQLLQLADNIPGFGMECVVQRVATDRNEPGLLKTDNSSVFRFGPLGSWRVSVSGCWRDNGGGLCADSFFQTFSIRPVSFLGFSSETFPEVVVPLPDVLKAQSSWCTTYLDPELRVSRGPNGGVFLFRRTVRGLQQPPVQPSSGRPLRPPAGGTAAASLRR